MFWLKFSFIVIMVLALISIVKFILRKMFKIEKVKKEFFSYHHINELHRKVDRWVRHSSAIILFVFVWILLFYYEDFTYLFTYGIIFFAVLDYSVKAFFEYTYSEVPKQAILTLAEMCLLLIATVAVVQLGLLGSYY
jgi:hypothetical protein